MAELGDERLPPRFWSKVRKDDKSGCWTWTAYLQRDGYAGFGLSHTTRLGHRVAYEALVGPVPNGLQLDHLCRNRACVNPEHLEPVTARENTLRGESLQAQNARKTACPYGHEYVTRGGRRYCLPCNAAAARRYYARKKQVAE